MRSYRIKEFVTIRDGILGLTSEQAKARAYALKEIEAAKGESRGRYEVLSAGVGFKAGEVIEADITITKALAVAFEDITIPAAAKQADPVEIKKKAKK